MSKETMPSARMRAFNFVCFLVAVITAPLWLTICFWYACASDIASGQCSYIYHNNIFADFKHSILD